MSTTLLLCFPKEREGDGKGRGPPALSSWGAPPLLHCGRGGVQFVTCTVLLLQDAPQFSIKNSPEPLAWPWEREAAASSQNYA